LRHNQVSIFFILFRESLEASIIVSVLLAMAESVVKSGALADRSTTATSGDKTLTASDAPVLVNEKHSELDQKRLLKKLRIQIFGGAAVGLLIALAMWVVARSSSTS
jgi:high-affinity iron transporter